jgi:hypothetical protein
MTGYVIWLNDTHREDLIQESLDLLALVYPRFLSKR